MARLQKYNSGILYTIKHNIRELKDGTGYKLTTAQYFTPSGEYINGKGIKPTIEEKDEEKQLDVALKWIKEQISK